MHSAPKFRINFSLYKFLWRLNLATVSEFLMIEGLLDTEGLKQDEQEENEYGNVSKNVRYFGFLALSLF